MTKRVLVATGGGDCPGLNATIRGIVKRASREPNWEIVGSIEAFHGFLNEPMDLMRLNSAAVAGIHVKGGTIIKTTNKGDPRKWPIRNADGSWSYIDRTDELVRKMQIQQFDALINIGGDGSQSISQTLFEKGCPVIGVPKTIDNDLEATDFTFGFQTAVEIATEAVDRLVTTAESHNRVMILEVMGRDAGWIALYSAVAGGADICLIPEIPYDLDKIVQRIHSRYDHGRGFVIIVIAEGAKPVGGSAVFELSKEIGYGNVKLGGAGIRLQHELQEAGLEEETRVSILGHLQRGGTPCASDRVLATQFGVRAFELVLEQKWGHMVAYRHPNIVATPIKDAISRYNLIDLDSSMIHTARGMGIGLGD
jgi:ATP-dependent phosphofructokinase / diphosphate-dependent phosphofructokinase